MSRKTTPAIDAAAQAIIKNQALANKKTLTKKDLQDIAFSIDLHPAPSGRAIWAEWVKAVQLFPEREPLDISSTLSTNGKRKDPNSPNEKRKGYISTVRKPA